MKKINYTIICLTVITIVEIITTHKCNSIILWILYGVYRFFDF